MLCVMILAKLLIVVQISMLLLERIFFSSYTSSDFCVLKMSNNNTSR